MKILTLEELLHLTVTHVWESDCDWAAEQWRLKVTDSEVIVEGLNRSYDSLEVDVRRFLCRDELQIMLGTLPGSVILRDSLIELNLRFYAPRPPLDINEALTQFKPC